MTEDSSVPNVSISPRALQILRVNLERDHGLETAAYLQEAGFAAGADLFRLFEAWLASEYGLSDAGDLAQDKLGDILSTFFEAHGWGRLSLAPMSSAILALDAPDWAEAAPDLGAQYPSCHFSAGLLADFLGRIAGEQLATMEVECLTRGDERCRFLVGAPEVLARVYQRMTEGMGYKQAT